MSRPHAWCDLHETSQGSEACQLHWRCRIRRTLGAEGYEILAKKFACNTQVTRGIS